MMIVPETGTVGGFVGESGAVFSCYGACQQTERNARCLQRLLHDDQNHRPSVTYKSESQDVWLDVPTGVLVQLTLKADSSFGS